MFKLFKALYGKIHNCNVNSVIRLNDDWIVFTPGLYRENCLFHFSKCSDQRVYLSQYAKKYWGFLLQCLYILNCIRLSFHII